MDSDIPRSNGSQPGQVTLQVPGEDRFLELLRGVVGRAARLSGFTFSGIEDFSLAVDEAAVLLLERQPLDLILRLEEVGLGIERLSAVVAVRVPLHDWPPSHDLGSDIRWQVLTALCEEVWLVDEEDRGIGLAQSVR